MGATERGTGQVAVALDEWVRSATEPRIRPIQGKVRQFTEEAVRAARSLEKRGDEVVARTKRGMFGMGDAKKSSSAMALMRISKEAGSACQAFYKQDWASAPLPKVMSGLSRLCGALAEIYNTSGRLAAKSFRSEAFSLSGEIETLHRINRQVSQFEARSRETLDAYDSIRDQARLIGEQLRSLDILAGSRVVLEDELRNVDSEMRSLQEKISDISKRPGIISLDSVEGELRGLRRKLLQEEMSRLGGLLERFSSVIQRGEAEQPREIANVLNGYLESPLTSLAKERDGYPNLTRALAGLLRAAESRKAGIGEKKARKGLERARRVVDGSLSPIQKEARKAFRARAELLRSDEVRMLRSQRLGLRGEYSRLSDSRKQLLSRKSRIEEETASGQAQVASRVDRVMKLAEEVFGKKMPLSLKEQVLATSRN